MLINILTFGGLFAFLYAAIKISDARESVNKSLLERGEIPDQRAIAEEHAAKRMTAKERKDLADMARGTSDNLRGVL